MKIIKLNKYCEKLKIRPVNINDMPSVNVNDMFSAKPCFTKSDLKTFDIVQLGGRKYMTFMNDDFFKISNIYKDIIGIEDGLFFYYRKSSLCSVNYMKVSDYNEDLSFDKAPLFNITDVWRKTDFMYKIDKMEMITQ